MYANGVLTRLRHRKQRSNAVNHAPTRKPNQHVSAALVNATRKEKDEVWGGQGNPSIFFFLCCLRQAELSVAARPVWARRYRGPGDDPIPCGLWAERQLLASAHGNLKAARGCTNACARPPRRAVSGPEGWRHTSRRHVSSQLKPVCLRAVSIPILAVPLMRRGPLSR
jgi:hypothetical protein